METTYYPAGHSMDSQWFAVDKDGHIGFFDTSDEGPLPIAFEKQHVWTEFLFENTIPIEGKLHKLILPDETVSEIINNCSTYLFDQLINDYEKDGFIYFEGFILLNDEKSWNDLFFQEVIDNSRGNFALKISEDKELYYLDDIYEYKNLFIEAVKNGIIKAAAFAELTNPDNDWEGNKFCIDIFGGFRFGNDDGWGHDPYRLDFIPENPLHISAFAEGTKDKIPVFENISFQNDVDGYIQALEHLSCHTYTRGDQTPVELLKMGYNKVKASDNESEIYCRMASIEYLADMMNLYDCNQCDNSLNYCSLSSKTDFPPILLLTRAEEKDRWELKSFIEEKVLPLLNIDEGEVYSTCCVKCVEDSHNNCHPKFEIECEYLKPILLIGVGQEVFNLLQSVYAINDSVYNNGTFYEISINKISLPLLTIDDKLENLSVDQIELIKQTVGEKLKSTRIIQTGPRVKRL
jgi:hypothetical protein